MEREQGAKRRKKNVRWYGSVYQPAGRRTFYASVKGRDGRWRSRSLRLKAVAENWGRAQEALAALRADAGAPHIPLPPVPTDLRRRGGSSGRVRAAYKTRHGITACEACGWTPPDGLGPSVLNTHHVKPRARGGDDSDENMVALCPNCHATAHALLKARRRHTKAELVLALMKLRKAA